MEKKAALKFPFRMCLTNVNFPDPCFAAETFDPFLGNLIVFVVESGSDMNVIPV